MAIIALGELPRAATATLIGLRRRITSARAAVTRRDRRRGSAELARSVLLRDAFPIDERPFRGAPAGRPEHAAFDIGRQLR